MHTSKLREVLFTRCYCFILLPCLHTTVQHNSIWNGTGTASEAVDCVADGVCGSGVGLPLRQRSDRGRVL
eukprot:6209197-Pleurochrysis_carterae.AAC.2